MAEIIFVVKDESTWFKLEDLVHSKNIKTKITPSVETACSWLKQMPYDAVLVDSGVSLENQQQIAGLLWSNNLNASFVMFDLEDQHTKHTIVARLYGAEVVKGKDALNQLGNILDRIKKTSGVIEKPKPELRLLVVEDLDQSREIICTLLETMGYPVVVGKEDAKKAMQELKNNPEGYDCIITDMRMPQITGKDLIDFVRANEKLKHLPVVVLTAFSTVDCFVDCLEAGASGFLVKPPKVKDLRRELVRARRIWSLNLNPRLASADEAKAIGEILVEKEFKSV